MGFLDKLLGRGKDAAESAGDASKDAGSKAADVGDEAKEPISGDEGSEGSDVTQAEDNVRDQARRDEGRMP